MSYVVRGLDPAPFEPLFGLSDEELEKRGAVRLTVTSHTFPCRVSLTDRAPGESVLLVNHVSHDVANPYRAAHAIFVTEVKQDAVLVPQRAVQEIQGLHSVLVVKADNTVEQRMVKAGERIANLWVINSGAKPGEKVIVEGIQKVRPGITVSAKPAKSEQPARAPSKRAAGRRRRGADMSGSAS